MVAAAGLLRTWRVLNAAANAVLDAPGATGSFSESVFAD